MKCKVLKQFEMPFDSWCKKKLVGKTVPLPPKKRDFTICLAVPKPLKSQLMDKIKCNVTIK